MPEMPANRIERKVVVENKRGFHLRQAGEISQIANQYKSDIRIGRVGKPGCDAKSMLLVLGLAASYKTELMLTVAGEDAAEAVTALTDCIEHPRYDA